MSKRTPISVRSGTARLTAADLSRPIGKGNPPRETQFKKGKSGNPKGRPRTLSELRKYIQNMGYEATSDPKLSRLDLLLRGMYAARNASDRRTVLEYGWGKVVQPITLSEMSDDQLKQYIEEHLGAVGGGADGSPEARPGAAGAVGGK